MDPLFPLYLLFGEINFVLPFVDLKCNIFWGATVFWLPLSAMMGGNQVHVSFFSVGLSPWCRPHDFGRCFLLKWAWKISPLRFRTVDAWIGLRDCHCSPWQYPWIYLSFQGLMLVSLYSWIPFCWLRDLFTWLSYLNSSLGLGLHCHLDGKYDTICLIKSWIVLGKLGIGWMSCFLWFCSVWFSSCFRVVQRARYCIQSIKSIFITALNSILTWILCWIQWMPSCMPCRWLHSAVRFYADSLFIHPENKWTSVVLKALTVINLLVGCFIPKLCLFVLDQPLPLLMPPGVGVSKSLSVCASQVSTSTAFIQVKKPVPISIIWYLDLVSSVPLHALSWRVLLMLLSWSIQTSQTEYDSDILDF